jgi:hypothetical protein
VFVDPVVSRAKFDRELGEFRAQLPIHHRRGIWLMDATFPEVFIVLMAVKTPPFIAVFGVVVNFENYDVEPPSIKFVHPVTRQLLMMREVPPLIRFKWTAGPDGKKLTGPNGEAMLESVNIVVAEDPERPGFMCLQGVREYHAHPAHTGDSWWLHRNTGVGRLSYLLNALASYSIDQISGLNLQIKFNGFNMNPRPE